MSDTVFYLFIGFFAVIVILILMVVVAEFLYHFSKELRFLNMEILRADGAERTYWKRRKFRLWLSLIPFFKY